HERSWHPKSERGATVLRETIRREKRYSQAATVAMGSVLVLFFLSFLFGTTNGDAAFTAFWCCAFPVCTGLGLPIVLLSRRYCNWESAEQVFRELTPYGDVEHLIDEIEKELGDPLVARNGHPPSVFADRIAGRTAIT